jgi:hypothetical protein
MIRSPAVGIGAARPLRRPFFIAPPDRRAREVVDVDLDRFIGADRA